MGRGGKREGAGRPVGTTKEVSTARPGRNIRAYDDEYILIKEFMKIVRKNPKIPTASPTPNAKRWDLRWMRSTKQERSTSWIFSTAKSPQRTLRAPCPLPQLLLSNFKSFCYDRYRQPCSLLQRASSAG